MSQLIGGVTGIASSVLGGNASKKASKKAQAQEDAGYNTASAATTANEGQVSGLYQPYQSFGADALGGLKTAFDSGSLTDPFTASNFQEDPGYQYRLQQSQNAVNSGAAARGQYYAPTTIKSLSDNAGNQASQEYQSAYQRFTDTQNSQYQKLMGLTGIGTAATTAEANNLTGSTDALNKLTLAKAGDDAQAITDRGAVTAKQWTDGLKSAGSIANYFV